MRWSFAAGGGEEMPFILIEDNRRFLDAAGGVIAAGRSGTRAFSRRIGCKSG
jgi:hypothetical protein